MPKTYGREIYNLEPSSKMYSGWNTDQILSEVMGVRSLDNKQYEQLVSKAFECVENVLMLELETTIDNLILVAHPSDTIVMVLQAKLAAMVATKND